MQKFQISELYTSPHFEKSPTRWEDWTYIENPVQTPWDVRMSISQTVFENKSAEIYVSFKVDGDYPTPEAQKSISMLQDLAKRIGNECEQHGFLDEDKLKKLLAEPLAEFWKMAFPQQFDSDDSQVAS